MAKAIYEGLKDKGEVKISKPETINESDFKGIDLLMVGSPVQAGRPLKTIKDLLDSLPKNSLQNIKTASFDTRIDMIIARLFRYAADKIDKELTALGGQQITPPMGFIVKDKEGPMREGELDRAKNWAKEITI